MNKLLLALVASSMLAGCAAGPTQSKDIPMNTSATLQPERSVALGPNASLRFDSAADSRCPPDVRCVWAGEISYKFTLSGAAGTESFDLTSAKPAFEATTVKGLRIALGNNVEPPVRASTAATAVPVPSVTVNITHQ